MRRCVALVLVSSLLSANALAAGKATKKGKKNEKPSGPSIETTAPDPASKEQSDKGPYRPQGKTGPLAEKAEEKAEIEEIVHAKPRDKAVIFGDAIIGFGQAPKPGPADEINDRTREATSVGFVLGGQFDFSAKFSLGLKLPITTASIDRSTPTGQTNGGSDKGTVLGSPLLYAEYRHPLSELTQLPILFGVGIPVAQGDPDPATADLGASNSAQIQLVADGASGYRNPEFYGPKRLPVVVGIGVRHERNALEIHADTKLVVGFNLGSNLANDKIFLGKGELHQRALAVRNVTVAGVTYDLTDKPAFWVGLDAWLVYNAVEGIKYVSSAESLSPFHLVAEPRVGARFGHVRPSLGFVYPIAGRLHDTEILGIRAHLDYAF
ncbi:MAG TPA: hypothetical protein VFQ61_29355 [Polyangiaceae bacterium]|nr:hypothetical protein [Polyangiaceae bacterium]